MRRIMLSTVALLMVLVLGGLHPATADAATNCFGRKATVVPDGHSYTMTAGDDVVVGTRSDDFVGGEPGGNDRVCLYGGDDFVQLNVAGSILVDAGTDNDTVFLQGTGTGEVSLGRGDDFGQIADLTGSLKGEDGNDTMFAVGYFAPGLIVDGGRGNDYCNCESADSIYGGTGDDILLEHSGPGATLLDCGRGNDTFVAVETKTVKNCELDY